MLGDLVEVWSYAAILLILVGINTVPLFMPPSWIVLSTIYLAYPSLNPFYLALIGATGATAGRFVLTHISSLSRRIIGEKRKTSLGTIEQYLSRKKYAYFLLSLIFAIGPLPSNLLFITFGIMKVRTFEIFLGFWIGRLISYFLLILLTPFAFKPFIKLFSSNFLGIIIIDTIGVISVVAFASVDWQKLIVERKVKFIRPKFRV